MTNSVALPDPRGDSALGQWPKPPRPAASLTASVRSSIHQPRRTDCHALQKGRPRDVQHVFPLSSAANVGVRRATVHGHRGVAV